MPFSSWHTKTSTMTMKDASNDSPDTVMRGKKGEVPDLDSESIDNLDSPPGEIKPQSTNQRKRKISNIFSHSKTKKTRPCRDSRTLLCYPSNYVIEGPVKMEYLISLSCDFNHGGLGGFRYVLYYFFTIKSSFGSTPLIFSLSLYSSQIREFEWEDLHQPEKLLEKRFSHGFSSRISFSKHKRWVFRETNTSWPYDWICWH